MKDDVLGIEKLSDEDIDNYYKRGIRGGALIASLGTGAMIANELKGHKFSPKVKKRIRKSSIGIAASGLAGMGISQYLHYKDKQNHKRKDLRDKQFALTPQNMGNMIQGNEQPLNKGPEEVTMRDLQLEQARLQRQQIQIQHQKSQLLLKDEMSRRRSMVQLQKLKKDEEDARIKNSIRVKKEETDKNEETQARNVSLYKSRPKLVQPVGMPRTSK